MDNRKNNTISYLSEPFLQIESLLNSYFKSENNGTAYMPNNELALLYESGVSVSIILSYVKKILKQNHVKRDNKAIIRIKEIIEFIEYKEKECA